MITQDQVVKLDLKPKDVVVVTPGTESKKQYTVAEYSQLMLKTFEGCDIGLIVNWGAESQVEVRRGGGKTVQVVGGE